MSEEGTFAIYSYKVLAKDVAKDDYILISGIPCWVTRIRHGENDIILIEGYGIYTLQYHENAFHPNDEIEVPIVIRGEISIYPNY